MRQPLIVTLTLNPAVDLSGETEKVVPEHKLRCKNERHDPGGGGINVARVLRRLGADPLAVFPVGGAVGGRLEKLVKNEGVRHAAIPAGGETRENITVLESTTGREYRFLFPGQALSTWDIIKCCDTALLSVTRDSWLIASGSLPPGGAIDTYAVLARKAASAGTFFALDASGAPLREALAAPITVLKLNEAELQSLSGSPLPDTAACVAAATALLNAGVGMVAVTRARKGALLVSDGVALEAVAPPIEPVSTVGAGDSFLAVLIWELARQSSPEEALRSAVAAGSAALVAPGTELSRPEVIWHLRPGVQVSTLSQRPSSILPMPMPPGSTLCELSQDRARLLPLTPHG